MTVSAFVSDDGYTVKAFVEGVYNLYPESNIEFRLSTAEQRTKLLDWHDSSKPSERPGIVAKAVSAKLVSWDLKDGEGKPVEISEENVAKLHPALFTRYRNIVAFLVDGGDKKASDEKDVDPGAEYLASLQKNS